jgi:hypothetical protein
MPTCRACGAASPDDARYCPTCGSPFAAALQPAPPAPPTPPAWGAPPAPSLPPAPPAPMPTMPGPAQPLRARPLGISILAVLDLLACVVLLLFGLVLAVAGPFIGSDPELQQQIAQDFPGGLGAMFGALLMVFGAVLIVLALVLGLVGWGLWQGRGWAWTLTVALEFIGLAAGLVQLVGLRDASAIVGLAINAFILWYFLQPGVKRWFGKGEPEVGMPNYVPPPSPPMAP